MAQNQRQSFHQACIICGSQNLKTLSGYTEAALCQCGNCSMVFSRKIPTLQELDNHYRNYSYSKEVFVSPVTITRYNELLDEFEKYRKNNLLLDVGCGVGLFLKVAIDRGWQVYGTEYSDKAIEICEAKGIKMKKGVLNAADFNGLQFDVVTSFEVIEHINNPLPEMENINALIRPGGLFYCTTPNFNALSRYYLKADYNIIKYPEHLSFYTPKTLKFLCKKFGFKSLRILTTGISFSRLSGSLNKNTDEPVVGATSKDEKVRQTIEGNKPLIVLKQLANAIFTLTGTGSALKGYFEKPFK
jgi:2-polyprenyl-3-methyl-5-hydroxy-6-metoxy-1,4-benzoquinol methylase